MSEKLSTINAQLDRLVTQRRSLFAVVAQRSGLYFGQPRILGYIRDHEGCTQIEIAETLGVSPASIALSTRRLQKAGFVEKSIDTSDMRRKKLYITEMGLYTLNYCITEAETVDETIFSCLTKEETDLFSDCLERLIHSTGKTIETFEKTNREKCQ